jgi:signal transduction histidine kinase
MQSIIDFFSTEGFMPHGMCLQWKPEVFWLHVVSDAVIAVSYYSIPFALLWFLKRRSDLAFPWMFQLFSAFILACGTTHILGIWTMWNPDYGVDGLVKLFTAIVSAVTAVLLWPLMPKALALPSTAQLRAINTDLAVQVRERLNAEESLRRLNDELEARVTERTRQLEEANAKLRAEIARRETMEKQIVQTQKMEAIGQLTGGLAHDFNNLLAVIIGNLDLLETTLAANPKAQQVGARAMTAAQKGADLTKKLLAFARRQSLHKEPIDVNNLVRNTMDLLKHLLGAAITVDVKPAPDLWPIENDASQVESVLTNVVLNARDAMPAGGHLWVSTSNVEVDQATAAAADMAPGAYVVLTVMDTGTGIAPDKIGRVFEPFFTTKEVGKGSGLGLSMVYGFVKQSGGSVKIESTPGKGTTVKIYLPRSQTVAQAAQTNSTQKGSVLEGLTVLVVEDNPDVRATVVNHLNVMDVVVLEAENAGEALEIIKAEPNIDLIFSDLNMPGKMNGADLAREARKMRPGIRVLITSGFVDSEQRGEGPDRIKHVLPKPYLRADLKRKIIETMSDAP